MNKLSMRTADVFKRAFEAGLILVGVENDRLIWMGDKVQWANYQEL